MTTSGKITSSMTITGITISTLATKTSADLSVTDVVCSCVTADTVSDFNVKITLFVLGGNTCANFGKGSSSGGYCYIHTCGRHSWQTKQSSCTRMGGRLPRITNNDEMAFLKDIMYLLQHYYKLFEAKIPE